MRNTVGKNQILSGPPSVEVSGGGDTAWSNGNASRPDGSASGGGGIVTAGLALHLDASDAASYSGSGTTWADLTANNFNFIFAGTPSWTSSPGYFYFEGNQADNADTISIASGAFEMWFRWRAGSVLTRMILAAFPSAWFSLGNSSSPPPDESMEYNAALTPTMDYLNGHTHFRDGVWYHVVAVIDGAANKLYVDGAAVATSFRFGSDASVGPLWAGSASRIGTSAGLYQYDSDIAVMRLYDAAAFSAADVLQNYNADQAKFKAFYPDSISSLALWLDPSADETLTTVVVGPDTTITEIRDKSRTLTDALAESAGAADPTLVSAGGINWMEFDGVNQYLQVKAGGATLPLLSVLGASATGWEMHAVIDADTATGTDVVNPFDNNNIIMDSGGYWGIAAAVAPAGTDVRIQPNAYDGGSNWHNYDVTKNEKHVFGLSYAGGAATAFTTYIDGSTASVSPVGASNTPNGLGGTLRLGAAYGSLYYNGRIGEVCIFDRPLTPAERANLLAYLKAKWGTP